MEKIGWTVLVVVAGALLPIQAGFNTRVGKTIDSPIWASLLSFAIGTIALLIYALISKTNLQLSTLKYIPAHYWTAGLLGAGYVTIVLLAFPKLGAALTFGLIVTGQLMMSVLLDHFAVLVPAQQQINVYRIAGLALIVAGVVIIRKF